MSIMTIVNGDDWQGVYIDGRLETEGHSIGPDEAVRLAIQHKVSEIAIKECDNGWLHDEGGLPRRLNDVQWPAPR